MPNHAIFTSLLSLCIFLPCQVFGKGLEKYAGIEIGGKGVKAIIITIDVSTDSLSIFKPEKLDLGKAANTTLSKVNEKGELDVIRVRDTGSVIKNCLRIFIDEHSINNKHIYIVCSSSVSKAPNISLLDEEIKKVFGLPPAHLKVEDEVSYAILGLMDDKDWQETALIDIGSGNVKGGYCEPGGRNSFFRLCTFANEKIPGTIEFGKLRQRSPECSVRDLRIKAIENPINDEIETLPMMRNAKRYYLCGGFIWAMARLLYPEKVRDEFVPLTIQDFELFRKMLGDGHSFPKARMERISNETLRLEAEAELAEVRRVFLPENLLDGAEIFDALINTCRLDCRVADEQKVLIFPRDAMFAWLLSFVRDNAFKAGAAKP